MKSVAENKEDEMKSKAIRSAVCFALLTVLASRAAFSQQTKPSADKSERHVGRITGAIAGAVGGFWLGFIVSDDDA